MSLSLNWMTTPLVTIRKRTVRLIGAQFMVAGSLIGAMSVQLHGNTWLGSIYGVGLIIFGAAALCCPEWFGRWL